MISSSVRPRHSAMSATVGERPSSWESVAVASLMSSLSSCRRRGTRMSQVRSRKCRLISPTIVGTAYAAKSIPTGTRGVVKHDGHDTDVVHTSGCPGLEHHHDPSRVGNCESIAGANDLTGYPARSEAKERVLSDPGRYDRDQSRQISRYPATSSPWRWTTSTDSVLYPTSSKSTTIRSSS